MSIRNKLGNVTDIILMLESVLKVEYKNKDVNEIIKRSKTSLENVYRVSLNNVDLLNLETDVDRFHSQAIDPLLSQVTEGLKALSLLNCLTLFDKRIGETLKDVNYIGFAKSELRVALKYLQSETLYETRESFVPALVRNVSNLPHSNIKRLLVIMLIMEALGIKEGVGIIAQYLYMGTVIK